MGLEQQSRPGCTRLDKTREMVVGEEDIDLDAKLVEHKEKYKDVLMDGLPADHCMKSKPVKIKKKIWL